MTNNDPTALQRLIIRAGKDSLAFSTMGEGNQVVYQPYAMNSSISMTANLREALRTELLLSAAYQRVLVVADTPTLLVPASLYRDDEQELLYRHAFTAAEQAAVMSAVVPDLNAVALFALQKDLKGAISDAFPQARFVPAMLPVWRHLHQRSYTGTRHKLYAYFHGRQMDVFCFAQNRFRFSNTYEATNPSDALYYLLAAWKQLAMDPQHDELHLAGELPAPSPDGLPAAEDGADGGSQAAAGASGLAEQAGRFLKRVFVVNPSGEFNRAAVAQIPGIPYDMVTLYMKGI